MKKAVKLALSITTLVLIVLSTILFWPSIKRTAELIEFKKMYAELKNQKMEHDAEVYGKDKSEIEYYKWWKVKVYQFFGIFGEDKKVYVAITNEGYIKPATVNINYTGHRNGESVFTFTQLPLDITCWCDGEQWIYTSSKTHNYLTLEDREYIREQFIKKWRYGVDEDIPSKYTLRRGPIIDDELNFRIRVDCCCEEYYKHRWEKVENIQVNILGHLVAMQNDKPNQVYVFEVNYLNYNENSEDIPWLVKTHHPIVGDYDFSEFNANICVWFSGFAETLSTAYHYGDISDEDLVTIYNMCLSAKQD